jgi:CAAX protease family protein
MIRSTPARQAGTFTALTYAMAVAVAILLPHAGAAPVVSVFLPTLSVLIMTFAFTRRGGRREIWRTLGLRRAGWRSWPVALGAPVLFLAIAYGVAIMLGVARLAAPDLSAGSVGAFVPNLLINLAVGSLIILGEEIGWRGYLLPRMQALTSRRRGAVATGLLHGLFHLPLILMTTTYDSVGNRYFIAPMVVLVITAAGVFYAWLRDRSGSIWPVAIAHNAANTLFALGSVAAITSSPVALAYVAGESGVATLAGVAGVAIYLLTRGAWPEPSSTAPPRVELIGADKEKHAQGSPAIDAPH